MNTFERRTYTIKNGTFSAVHFGRISNPLKVVFLHANGFNALSYRTLLQDLGVHVVALDVHGHGMSDLPANPKTLRNWHYIADDIIDYLSHHTHAKVMLAGHSMGAAMGILAAAKSPEHIHGLCAFDPPTLPRTAQFMPYLPGGRGFMKKRFSLAKNAGRRRKHFDSHAAAFERYHRRGTFKHMDEAVLHDYLKGGLVPHSEGVKLACDPLWEQAVYVSHGHNLYKAATSLPKHSKIIYAGGMGAASLPSTRARMAKALGADKVEYHTELTHFFPLENPDYARAEMLALLKQIALNP
ncbi:MAG TPA: alpha/beta hydrolase [Hellea balneolensis]|uniref:Alpha/beta hydrolase n=1 Tax=Hellea balneolensis TaxID=287478 RepID=A0A7C3GKE1_9PROT|nr:alpha/beta hydrolase [Hellea balneolensis]